jgi:hypothetical protein
MSRNLIFLSHGSTKIDRAGLETIQAGAGGQPKGGYVDGPAAGPTPKKPVDITARSPQKKGPTSVQKTYPLSMIRKVVRNDHGSGSVVDLQLLRSMRWPA